MRMEYYDCRRGRVRARRVGRAHWCIQLRPALLTDIRAITWTDGRTDRTGRREAVSAC